MGKRPQLAFGLVLAGIGTAAWGVQADQSAEREPVREALANVCHLSTSRSSFGLFGGDNNAAAVLYRGRYLITAAHNVASPFYRTLDRLDVACGRSEPTEAMHVRIDRSQVRVACGYRWFPRKRFARDYSVIRLESPIDVPRPLALRAFSRTDPLPGAVTLAGFPGQPADRDGMTGERLFSASGAGRFVGRHFVEYEIRTYPGNSGGPVWIEEPDGPRLVGIHVSDARNGEIGRARMVDSTVEAEIEAMIASLESGGSHCGRRSRRG
jgi:V8-like Glu-specific endopeptidase